jgi:2'-5' RNA ligase
MQQEKIIRSFIAVYPDDAARAHMADVIEEMRRANGTIKWEAPRQVHITVKFIGDIAAARLRAIAADLHTSLAGTPVIKPRIDRTGVFPNFRRPRIVWLGPSVPPAPLIKVQSVVEDVCSRHGVAREKQAFTPHFTIGRVKDRSDTGGLEDDLSACIFDPIPVTFSELRIMESVLAPTGAVHTVLDKVEFV